MGERPHEDAAHDYRFVYLEDLRESGYQHDEEEDAVEYGESLPSVLTV